MPTARDRFAVSDANGIIYAIGGQNGTGSNLTTVESYNPATNTWTPGLAAMPTGRDNLVTVSVGGIIYAIGGFNGTTVVNTVEAYNPATNTWTPGLAAMPTARCNMAAAVVGGIIYVFGGDDAAGNPLATVESYNPATNTWTPGLAAMPTALSQMSVGTVGGIIYMAGGDPNPGEATTLGVVTTVESYNPATNTWTSGLAPMPSAAECDGGQSLACQFYVVGGAGNGAFPGIMNTVQDYDPVSNTWTVESSMPTAQDGQGFDVVNNVLYSIGGWSGGGFLNTNQGGATTCVGPTNTPTSTPTQTPTPTVINTPCGFPGNTCTPTFTPTPTPTVFVADVFTVSQNLFHPSQPVTIYVEYTSFPGNYDLQIFNTAGEHIRTLDSHYMTQPVNQTYSWDGKNEYGDPCASGVYIIYLTEPLSVKSKRVILVR